MMAAQAAQADEPFINPDWANSAVYIGAGIGQSRASIDEQRIRASLTANGASVSSFSANEREAGYKLFIGKQLNQYFAVEAGYFDLGTFGFDARTSGNGMLGGEAGFRGVNVDLVGQLPLNQRLSLLARAGANYAKTSTHFSGNRLAAVTNPSASERKLNAKVGLGAEYKFSEALAGRAEIERYRLNDAIGNRGDVDLVSFSLVYKLGRPAARPVVASVIPEPVAAAPVVEPAPAVAAAPVAVSEKVTFAAEALFDFDKAIVKPEGKQALDELVSKLQGMQTEVMIAVGHTDAVGSDAYNQKLSLSRAEAVKAYIVSKGLTPSRVYTEGKGESQPIADNANSAGRAKNRRVSVEVVGTRTGTK
ncbi:OmpA family protein [Massilia sp. RP-1-19]|uniref:OmpA family protein n=2 Tax=Massilia polaris TaxID=2728846 RepID=A0A848HXR2_9BURK|nr:OmpA family protein [Massilia polaris]